MSQRARSSSVSGSKAGSNKPGAREPAMSQGPTKRSGSHLASNVSMSQEANNEEQAARDQPRCHRARSY